MQEIDEFFDQLDPNIDVIWGTSTDNTLGEDAKVTILATGLENDLKNEEKGVAKNEDGYYEDLIPLLYKPTPKKPVEEHKEEPKFVVEPAPIPEPAPAPEPQPLPEPEPIVEERPKERSTLEKMKDWLNGLVGDVRE